MTIRPSTSKPVPMANDTTTNQDGEDPKHHHNLLMVHSFSSSSGSNYNRAFDRIRDEFPGVEVRLFDTADGKVPLELWQSATLLVTLSNLPEKIEDVPNLQLIHLVSAGNDHISSHWIMKDPKASKITITTSSGIHGPPIAEWVIMTSLVLTKHYNQMHDWQKQHQWGGKATWFNSSGDWVGKTVGILGYGSIGRQVARVFAAMGVNIHAYTNSPRDTPEAKKDDGYVIPHTGDPEGTIPQKWFSAKREGLDEFLSSGLHALVICTPLTPDTTNLLTTKEFEILQKHSPYTERPIYFNSVKVGDESTPDTNKNSNASNTNTNVNPSINTQNDSNSDKHPGAIILNISRGKIIHQKNLIDALKPQSQLILGAALDVTDPEPLDSQSELWDLPNVIITPHMSAVGSEYLGRSLDVLRVNLGRLIRGDCGGRLVNVVKRERGY